MPHLRAALSVVIYEDAQGGPDAIGNDPASLDLCAGSAAEVGDLDEAVRCLERATELDPDEEDRDIIAARHLLTQGRRGAARTMLQRARLVVDEIGVRPSAALLEQEHQLQRRMQAV